LNRRRLRCEASTQQHRADVRKPPIGAKSGRKRLLTGGYRNDYLRRVQEQPQARRGACRPPRVYFCVPGEMPSLSSPPRDPTYAATASDVPAMPDGCGRERVGFLTCTCRIGGCTTRRSVREAGTPRRLDRLLGLLITELRSDQLVVQLANLGDVGGAAGAACHVPDELAWLSAEQVVESLPREEHKTVGGFS
jgi:hypothetical protein